MFAIFVLSAVLEYVIAATINVDSVPPYVKQCYQDDPKLVDCFVQALHHLKPYLATGIKEIELPSVEPFIMEELTLSLTTGPNGYRVSLKEIDIFGASNFSVTKMRLSENGKPFESRIRIPQLRIHSRYQSSGVLIILPASGNGTFDSRLEDVNAIVRGTVSTNKKDGLEYLHVDTLNVDIIVKNVYMHVTNIFRNNRILTDAINLFLRENGQEVFKAMLPQLRKKLSLLFQSIANQLLVHIPIQSFYVSTTPKP